MCTVELMILFIILKVKSNNNKNDSADKVSTTITGVFLGKITFDSFPVRV